MIAFANDAPATNYICIRCINFTFSRAADWNWMFICKVEIFWYITFTLLLWQWCVVVAHVFTAAIALLATPPLHTTWALSVRARQNIHIIDWCILQATAHPHQHQQRKITISLPVIRPSDRACFLCEHADMAMKYTDTLNSCWKLSRLSDNLFIMASQSIIIKPALTGNFLCFVFALCVASSLSVCSVSVLSFLCTLFRRHCFFFFHHRIYCYSYRFIASERKSWIRLFFFSFLSRPAS